MFSLIVILLVILMILIGSFFAYRRFKKKHQMEKKKEQDIIMEEFNKGNIAIMEDLGVIENLEELEKETLFIDSIQNKIIELKNDRQLKNYGK